MTELTVEILLPLHNLIGAAECLRTIAHPLRLRIIQILLLEICSVGSLPKPAKFQATSPQSI